MTSSAGTTAYSYDAADRRSHVASPAGSFDFGYCEWNGKLAASTNGHGFVVQYEYDVMDRVTNIAWKTTSGATLGGFEYEYDAAGRIVSRSHALGDPSHPSHPSHPSQMSQSSEKTYAYDSLDRLASDDGVAYTYDAAGNRMTKTVNGATVTYTLGVGDRLASWTGGAYTHDIAGNVTRIERTGRPTLDLTWNSQYQLVSVSTNGVFAEGYEYDALSRRVSTTTLEGTTRHVYDDNWQVVADLDEQNNVVASYTWGDGIDKLLAVKVGGATYYPLTDIQGTVWGYVDSQNNAVARWQYDAWGNVLSGYVVPSAAALANIRYRFQCREWSAATGLVNFRMRWYDAETGRWLSKDPIGLSGGLNLYAFCGDGPMERIDPFGLWGIWFGSIRLGNDEPWMIFDRSSLNDLKRGAAATADGVLSAVTMNGLFGLFNPNLFDSNYDSCDYDTGISHALGSYSFGILTIAFSLPQGIARGSSQVVTHWGPTGMTGLRSGDWVMTGGASFRNWLMAGAKSARSGWESSITTTVPKASLQYPPGWEWWKGLIGQRVYMP